MLDFFSTLKMYQHRIENYLMDHIDMILGLCNIGLGWSVIDGPEADKFDGFILGDTIVPGVLLLTSGIMLLWISFTDLKWKNEFFILMIPTLVYIVAISRELFIESDLRPSGLNFLLIGFVVVTYLSLRRIKFMNR